MNERVLTLSDDRLTLSLASSYDTAHAEALLERAAAELGELHAADEMREQALAILQERLSAGPSPIQDLMLLQGTPPTPPVDGRIEWFGNFEGGGFKVDARTGRMDYRARAAEASVDSGQAIARIIPPVPGEDGVDALGRRIAAPRMRPARLRPGHNVRFDEATGMYFAACAGHIRVRDSAVSVEDVYQIAGSIGIRTGHVYHPGSLVVQGNIEPGSIVRASGDIVVHGCIDDAQVESGGNVTVHGGVTGADAFVKAEGRFSARYIQNAKIACGDLCAVENEIDNAEVMSRGAVHVARGRISGGRIVALGGIETVDAGSHAAIHTLLHAGTDPSRESLLREYTQRIALLDELIEKVHRQSDPIFTHHPHLERLPDQVHAALDALRARIAAAEASRERIVQEREAFLVESKEHAVSLCLIHREINAETSIMLGTARTVVRQPLQGPLLAILRSGKIHLVQTDAPDLRRAAIALGKASEEEESEDSASAQ